MVRAPKGNRWKRYSLRSLIILVTLICIYFGTWSITQRWGTTSQTQLADDSKRVTIKTCDSEGVLVNAKAIMPFIVVHDEYVTENGRDYPVRRDRPYIWFFGLRCDMSLQRCQIEVVDMAGRFGATEL